MTPGGRPSPRVLSLLLSCSLVALGLVACRPDESPPEPPREPRPLVVLGIDGMTWDLIDPMVVAGEMPHFEALLKRSFRADLVSLPPLSSPVVWTTYATGRFARDHNVLDHTYPYKKGPKRRIRSTQRRVPALWNIADYHGRSVSVIGYFATHPADEVSGWMVSDRASQGLPGGVYPPDLAEELAPELERLKDVETRQEIYARYLPWELDLKALDRPDDPYHRVTEVAKGRLTNQPLFEDYVKRVSLKAAERQDDLLAIYLRMPDHASHATWLYFEPDPFEDPPSDFDRELLEDVIPESYRRADAYLGQLLEAIGDEVNLVLLSDHGFGPATGEWSIGRESIQHLSGNHRPDGIFLAAGPDIDPSRKVPGTLPNNVPGTTPNKVPGTVTAMDVAPTLLALMGLPLSEELPGRVVDEALRSGFLEEFPQNTVSGFRMRWRTVESGEAAEEEPDAESQTMEELASLGYVDRSTTVATEAVEETVDFWEVEPHLRRNALVGEMLFHVMRSDLESADIVMREVEAKDLDFSRHLPRLVRKNLARWSQCFDQDLVDPEVNRRFEAMYPGHLFERGAPAEEAP